jgi:transposase InsO family protein
MGLRCKQKRRFKATTNSNHNLPVAENLLDQRFVPSARNQLWVTDIERHEAPLNRVEVQCLHPLSVAADGEKLRTA